ncbi:MAG: hypothetical protein COA40_05755 [Aequorivita sp.]|nr:MAG: hypothetical protein COA40_05755 [Aequorivita sp.]
MNAKLLIISYDFPPSTGGIARLCHEIILNIKNSYDTVEVLTIEKNHVSQPYGDNSGIKIHYLSRKRILSELKAFQFLRKWKHKKQTDVICGTWHPDAALALFAGFKNVYTLAHGAELLSGKSTFRKHLWLPVYAKWVLGKSRKVIANSNYTKNLVHQINPAAKAVDLPLGVNTDYFKPLKVKKDIDKLRICTVSRILQFKGHDFILETLCQLPKQYREKLEWHIAGIGPFLEPLKKLVQNSVIAPQVHFHGFVQDSDLPAFYNSSDLFILATRQAQYSTQVEGFGLVFLEAQSCGIPVIGTHTGGIPDAIEPENGGWLIAQDDKMELTGIIAILIENPPILKEQSVLARQRVLQKCSWQHYIANLKQLME